MSLLNFLRATLGGANQRAPGTQSGESGSFSATSATRVNKDTALNLSAFWASVRLISETIASMPLRIWELQEGGTRKLATDHQLSILFSGKVNRYQTRFGFFETMTMNLCMHGNAYALKQFGTRKRIVGLLPLMADQMEVTLDINGSIEYRYNDGRTITLYTEDQIWHIPLMGNAIIGLSPLSYARNSIGTGLAADNTTGKIFKNEGKPSAALSLPNAITSDQRKQLKENFGDMVSGDAQDNLFVLEFGMTYKQIQMSPADIELLSSRSFQLKDVARFMGVPSVLINDIDGATVWGTGIGQIVLGWYKLGLRPYLERYEASIVTSLLPVAERRRIAPEFDFNSLLRADLETRIKANKDSIQGGFKTPNEARLDEGMEPMEGGDNLYLQKQNVPLSQLDDIHKTD